jgi:general secretion pathway protein N
MAAQNVAGGKMELGGGVKMKRSRIIGLSLLCGGMLLAGPAPQLFAATSATLDILPDERGAVSNPVDVGAVKPLAIPNPARDTGEVAPRGNPLWSIPLSALTATQERPIFSASRRPPQRAVVAPHVDQVEAPLPPKPAAPERPPLALIGAVIGEGDAIAVFLDRTSQKVIRLRQGETHAGWKLSAVQRREVTLKKADWTEVVALQRVEGPVGAPTSGAPGPGPIIPGPTIPASGGTDTSYAPFVPRSTPRNGESDGL